MGAQKANRNAAFLAAALFPSTNASRGFVPYVDLLASASHAMLYQRGKGRLRSAVDLTETDDAVRSRRE